MMKRDNYETSDHNPGSKRSRFAEVAIPTKAKVYGVIPVDTPKYFQPTNPRKYRKEGSMVLVSRDFFAHHFNAWQKVSVLRRRTSELEGDFHRWCKLTVEQASIEEAITREGIRLIQAKAKILASHAVSWEELQNVVGRVERKHTRCESPPSKPAVEKHENRVSRARSANPSPKSAFKKEIKATKHVQFDLEDIHVIGNLKARAYVGKVGMYIKPRDLDVLLKGKYQLELEQRVLSDLEVYKAKSEEILETLETQREKLDSISCVANQLQAILLLMDFDVKSCLEYEDANKHKEGIVWSFGWRWRN
jgi:hypothetical protein